MLCAIDFSNLHSILRSLYDEMMPLCGDMAGVAQGIAGLGALFYVAYRIWQSLARAEPIDVFPLLRPFVIGFCIMFFPTVVLGTINNVMSPIVQGTAGMLDGETINMQELHKQKEQVEYEAMLKDPSTAYLVSDEEFDRQIDELGVTEITTAAGMYIERGLYNLNKYVRDIFYNIIEVLFDCASLCIDTIRTFFLVVLSILGPLAFAISVWDGFQSTLTQWFCRYIQVYLWLPVSDLLGTILAKLNTMLLQHDIEMLQSDPNFFIDSTNTAYIILMLIGIVGYFTVPTVAGWIIQAGGAGNYNRAVNNSALQAGSAVGSISGAASGNAAGHAAKTVGRAGKLLK